MDSEKLELLGFKPCDGSSLNTEQVNAIQNGMVVIKSKSEHRIKIFVMIDDIRYSIICKEAERNTYLRKLDNPEIFGEEES